MVGYANIPSGERHAFLYSKGTMTDLGVLPGGTESIGWGINKAGQVAGWVFKSSGEARAFLYSNGTMTDLGTLGGGIVAMPKALTMRGRWWDTPAFHPIMTMPFCTATGP